MGVTTKFNRRNVYYRRCDKTCKRKQIKILMKLLKWIKDSFEGSDGKASSRKLTIFTFTVMYVVTWFVNLFLSKQIDQGILLIMGVFILVGHAILSAQNIVDILKRPQNSYYDNDVYNPYGKSSNSDNPGDIPPTE